MGSMLLRRLVVRSLFILLVSMVRFILGSSVFKSVMMPVVLTFLSFLFLSSRNGRSIVLFCIARLNSSMFCLFMFDI